MKTILCVTVILRVMAAASAERDEDTCREAISRYSDKIGEVNYNLQKFLQCVSDSRGKDACYREFKRLQDAHDDFEIAVQKYKESCRD